LLVAIIVARAAHAALHCWRVTIKIQRSSVPMKLSEQGMEHGLDLNSDVLPFGRLWDGEPKAQP
jgi:hypothetical protein